MRVALKTGTSWRAVARSRARQADRPGARMMASAAIAGLLFLMGVAPAEDRCIELTLEVDGTTVEGAHVELSVSGRQVVPEKCSGGFVGPQGVSREEEVGVVVTTPDRKLDFGLVYGSKVLGVAAWHVVVDTPPFQPGYWSLGASPEAKEIWGIGFEPLEGDGTAMIIYGRPTPSEVFAPDHLGGLLLRIDLLEAGRIVILPRRDEWTLETPVKLVDPGSAASGVGRWSEQDPGEVITAECLRELAEDVLSEQPGADAMALLEAVKQRHRACAAPE